MIESIKTIEFTLAVTIQSGPATYRGTINKIKDLFKEIVLEKDPLFTKDFTFLQKIAFAINTRLFMYFCFAKTQNIVVSKINKTMEDALPSTMGNNWTQLEDKGTIEEMINFYNNPENRLQNFKNTINSALQINTENSDNEVDDELKDDLTYVELSENTDHSLTQNDNVQERKKTGFENLFPATVGEKMGLLDPNKEYWKNIITPFTQLFSVFGYHKSGESPTSSTDWLKILEKLGKEWTQINWPDDQMKDLKSSRKLFFGSSVFNFAYPIASILLRQNIPLLPLLKSLSQISLEKISLTLTSFEFFDKYSKETDFFFCNREELEKDKKKQIEYSNLLQCILGDKIKNVSKMPLDLQLLLLEIFSHVNSMLKAMDNKNEKNSIYMWFRKFELPSLLQELIKISQGEIKGVKIPGLKFVINNLIKNPIEKIIKKVLLALFSPQSPQNSIERIKESIKNLKEKNSELTNSITDENRELVSATFESNNASISYYEREIVFMESNPKFCASQYEVAKKINANLIGWFCEHHSLVPLFNCIESFAVFIKEMNIYVDNNDSNKTSQASLNFQKKLTEMMKTIFKTLKKLSTEVVEQSEYVTLLSKIDSLSNREELFPETCPTDPTEMVGVLLKKLAGE
jgi:hypothetical protein